MTVTFTDAERHTFQLMMTHYTYDTAGLRKLGASEEFKRIFPNCRIDAEKGELWCVVADICAVAVPRTQGPASGPAVPEVEP